MNTQIHTLQFLKNSSLMTENSPVLTSAAANVILWPYLDTFVTKQSVSHTVKFLITQHYSVDVPPSNASSPLRHVCNFLSNSIVERWTRKQHSRLKKQAGPSKSVQATPANRLTVCSKAPCYSAFSDISQHAEEQKECYCFVWQNAFQKFCSQMIQM